MLYLNEWLWLCSNNTLFIKTGGGPDLVHRLEFTDICSKDLKGKLPMHLQNKNKHVVFLNNFNFIPSMTHQISISASFLITAMCQALC